MNTQEAYERMVEHFSRPGAVIAFDVEAEACKFRVGLDRYTEEKCAVGCLIPNSLYEPWMDSSVRSLSEILRKSGLANVDYDFLVRAQSRHDDSETPSDFLPRLHELAEQFDLELVA